MSVSLDTRTRLFLLALLVAAGALLLAVAGSAEAKRVRHHGKHRPQLTLVHMRTHRVHMRTHVNHAFASRLTLSVVSETPTDGATVSGTVPWKVSAAGVRVTRVAFAVDGTVEWVDRSAPFTYGSGLDTTALANGIHRLTATAYARHAKPASATIRVTVSNPITAPPAGGEPAPTPAPELAPAPESAPQPEPAPAPAPEPAPAPAPEPEATPESSPAPEPEPAPSPSTSKVYWGAWIGSQLTGTEAPWDMSAVTKFEEMTGKRLSIVNFSAPFANCSGSSCSFYNFPVNEFNSIRAHGAIPFYSWGSQSIPVPSNLSEPNFQLSDVIAGNYDSYIRRFAEAAKAWGHPFFLRFNWEMNGNWFAWDEGVNGNQPGEYVAAWRHVHDIFTQVGATNATWVWCPNVDPESKWKNLASLYPGNEYVDWTGLDGYNWGTNPARPDRWRTFSQLYSSTYKRITETIAPSKPMIVSEVGSTEYGGSKATWIREMLSQIPTQYPKIRGVLWFEKHDDGMDWPIESSSSATSAFAAGIQNPAYTTNTFGSLGFSAVTPAG